MNIIKKILFSLTLSFAVISSSFAMEPTGLDSGGKTRCYAHSVFQVLVLIPGIEEYLLQFNNQMAKDLSRFLQSLSSGTPNQELKEKIIKNIVGEAGFYDPGFFLRELFAKATPYQEGNPLNYIVKTMKSLGITTKYDQHTDSDGLAENFANIIHIAPHYFVTVKKNGIWYTISDDHVSLNEGNTVQNGNIRISFYKKSETNPAPEITLHEREQELQRQERLEQERLNQELQVAAENNDLEQASWLIQEGANPRILNHEYMSSLLLYAKNQNYFNIVTTLIMSGADIRSLNYDDISHLLNNITNSEAIKALIEKEQELFALEREEIIRFEIEREERNRLEWERLNQELRDAVENNDLEKASWLIQEGANPRIINHEYMPNLLEYAVSQNYFNIVTTLITSGASIEILYDTTISDLLSSGKIRYQAKNILEQEQIQRESIRREQEIREREKRRTNIIIALKENIFMEETSILGRSEITNTYLEEDVLAEILTRYKLGSAGFFTAKTIIRSNYDRNIFLEKIIRFISSNLLEELTNLQNDKLKKARNNIHKLYIYLEKNHPDLVRYRKRRTRRRRR